MAKVEVGTHTNYPGAYEIRDSMRDADGTVTLTLGVNDLHNRCTIMMSGDEALELAKALSNAAIRIWR